MKNVCSQPTVYRCRSSMSAVTSAHTSNNSHQGVPLGATRVMASLFAAGVEAVKRTSPTTHQER
jgi:hypothetical protein